MKLYSLTKGVHTEVRLLIQMVQIFTPDISPRILLLVGADKRMSKQRMLHPA